MQPWHLFSVTLNMREEDRADFEKVYGEIDLQRWACQRAITPGHSFALLAKDGRPVVCFGFIPDVDPAVATSWFIGTADAKHHVKEGVIAFREIVKAAEFRVVEARCTKTHPYAKRWLTWLGFTYRGEIPGYCHSGEPMEMYSMNNGALT